MSVRSSRALVVLAKGRPARVVVSAATAALGLALLGAVGPQAQVAPAAAATAAPKVTERPDRISASRAAVAQKSAVEVLSDRSETQTTYANPDGSFTTENYAGPKRVRQSDGTWADVDLTLVSVNGQIVPKVAAVPLALSAGGSTTLATQTMDTGVAQVSWGSALPVPVLNGTTATYPEVLPGVDLLVEALRTGFDIKYVVKSKPSGPLALPLSLSLQGLSAARRGDGGLTITDDRGKVVGDSGQPVVFDASVVPGTNYPARQSVAATLLSNPVAAALAAVTAVTRSGRVAVGAGAKGKRSTWTLTPDSTWMSDPATKYPVTVDPTIVMSTILDTYIDQTNPTNAFSTSTRMYIGTPTGSGDVKRSFVAFAKPTALAGMFVSDSYVQLFNSYSSTCGASLAPVYVYGLAASFASTVSWGTRPSNVWTGAMPAGTSNYVHNGPNNGCGAAAYDNVHITSLAQSWADGTNKVYSVQVSSVENDVHGYKEFYASDAGSGVPTLRTTYWAYPTVVGAPVITGATAVNGVFAVNSLTPLLKQSVGHASGLNVQAQFVIKSGTTTLWTGNGTTVAAGAASTIQVPAGILADGGTYTLQTRGLHATQYSKAYSSVVTFQVHATVPPAPTVTSSTYAANSWAASLTPGTFTFATTQSDVNRYTYQFDSGAWTTVAPAAPGGTATATITPPAGWHTLNVKTVNVAGMESATSTSYTFGAPGMSSPSDGDKSLQFVTLNAAAPTTETGVRFQYQLPGSTTWTDIPVAQVKQAGTTIPAWPVATVVSGSQATAPSQLVWDAKTTLGNDTPVAVQAVFTGASTITSVNNPTTSLDSKAYGLMYATADVGVGSVSLQTGNLAVSDNDAEVASFGGGLSVSRTFNSLDPTLAPATGSPLYGPGWSSGLTSDISEWVKAEDQGTQVKITDTDGGQWFFAKTGATTYAALTDAALAGYTLVGAGTAPNRTFTLTSIDGAVTTITPVNTAWVGTPSRTTPEPYQVTSTRQPGINGTATFEYNADGTPKALYAPTAAGVTCSTTAVNAGCRMLVFTYADADATAAVANRLSKVTLKTTDAAGAAVTVDVACYTYDATASFRLSKVWDPRVAASGGWASTCAGPVQATTYAYDASGRIASITADGLAPVVIAYSGTKFVSATRTHSPAFGSAALVSSVVYGVSIAATTTADDTHPDLSPAAIATWGQTTAPLSAAIVYGPGDVVSSTDLKDGTVYALDADGRTADTAVYSGTGQAGWRVDSTDYADNGNVVRTLSAANRDRALNPGSYPELADLGLGGATGPAIAEALSTRTFYSADGVDVTDVYGPAHQVVLPDGTQAPARSHDHTDYGTVNYPTVTPASWTTGAPLHTAVRTTQSATLSLSAVPISETDTTETRSVYGLSATDHVGWDLRQAMSTTVENGTTDITSVTRYDANGNVVEQRQPSATAAANPGTRVTTYYAAGALNTATCTSTVWYGQVCRTAPGAQPTTAGLPGLVSTTYQYDAALRPVTTTETVVPSGGGSSVRTTTTTYANSGASTQVGSVAITGGVGTAVPTTTLGYDATTGLPRTTSNGVKTQTVDYDDFGQPVAYTDGDGAKTKLTRDSRDRLATTTWTKVDGTTTLGSATYAYVASSTGDHRGSLKSITDSTLGAVTATYDGLGRLLSQKLASGLTQSFDTDPTGDAVGTTWTDTAGNVFLEDAQVSDVHGRWRTESLSGSDPGWNGRYYVYDGAGRLTSVAEQTDNADCVTRAYAFDVNSNRTSSASYPADASGNCAAVAGSQTSSVSLAYDNADRMLSAGSAAGVVYDAWGRITSLPAALTSSPGSTAATTGYYANDLVASLTQGGGTRSWTLDPGGRLASMSTTGLGSTALVNHYGEGSSDSPVWTSDTSSTGTVTTRRYVSGFAGLLAEVDTTGTTTTTAVQLTGLHGDVLRTTTPGATASPDGAGVYTDEYGQVLDPDSGAITTGPRYGWLGGKQRGADAGSVGLVLMGVRLYAPTVGRFLSVDAVYGGNANSYSYPVDPVNRFDLDGRFDWGNLFEVVVTVVTVVSLFTCTICSVGLAIYGAYKMADAWRRGDTGEMLWEAAGLLTFGAGRLLARGAKFLKEAKRLSRAAGRAERRGRSNAYRIRQQADRAQHRAAHWRAAGRAHRAAEYSHMAVSTSYNHYAGKYGW